MHSIWAYLTAMIFIASAFLAVPAAAEPEGPETGIQRLGGTFMTGTLDGTLEQTPAGELVAFYERQSVAFDNVRYHQVIDGVRVHEAGASEHTMLRHPSITLSHADLVPFGVPLKGSFEIAPDVAVDIAQSSLGVKMLIPGTSSSVERVWFQDDDVLRAAYAVDVSALDPAGAWRVVVDAVDARVLEKEVRSEVFDPGQAHDTRALSTPEVSQLLTGALDTSDIHSLANAQATEPRRTDYAATVHQVSPIVAMQDEDFRDNVVGIDDGSFSDGLIEVTIEGVHELMPLQTDRTWVMDALTVPAAGLDLDFRRDDPRFLEVMILYYVEVAQDIMEEHGYDRFFPGDHVRAISRVPSPLPNALATTIDGQGYIVFFYRSPGGPPLYGGSTGFATSSEDAEVIVHELGHLMHTAAAPSAGGPYRGAWAEGSADFYAALLLEGPGLSEGFGDPCVGEWFTSYLADPVYEGLPCIRVLDHNMTYPEDAGGSGHFNGQFWSGPNWEIRQEIGQNESIVLFTEALHLTPSSISNFTVLADTVTHADCALTDCERFKLVEAAFGAKNIGVSPLPEEFQELVGNLSIISGVQEDVDEELLPGPVMIAVVALVVASAGLLRGRGRE